MEFSDPFATETTAKKRYVFSDPFADEKPPDSAAPKYQDTRMAIPEPTRVPVPADMVSPQSPPKPPATGVAGAIERGLKGFSDYMDTPPAPATGFVDKILRQFPEGVDKAVYQMGKGALAIPGAVGETFKQVANQKPIGEMFEPYWEMVKGLYDFVGTPIGAKGYRAMLDRWEADPGGAFTAVASVLSPLAKSGAAEIKARPYNGPIGEVSTKGDVYLGPGENRMQSEAKAGQPDPSFQPVSKSAYESAQAFIKSLEGEPLEEPQAPAKNLPDPSLQPVSKSARESAEVLAGYGDPLSPAQAPSAPIGDPRQFPRPQGDVGEIRTPEIKGEIRGPAHPLSPAEIADLEFDRSTLTPVSKSARESARVFMDEPVKAKSAEESARVFEREYARNPPEGPDTGAPVASAQVPNAGIGDPRQFPRPQGETGEIKPTQVKGPIRPGGRAPTPEEIVNLNVSQQDIAAWREANAAPRGQFPRPQGEAGEIQPPRVQGPVKGPSPVPTPDQRIGLEVTDKARELWQKSKEAKQAPFSKMEPNIQPAGIPEPVQKLQRMIEEAKAKKGEKPVEPAAKEIRPEPKVIDRESYLSQAGAGRQDIGESALHKNRGGKSDKAWSKIVDSQAKKDWELIERREELRKEYDALVERGEARPPTQVEKLIQTAQGHEDNAAVQAARRVLEKRGISWEPSELKMSQEGPVNPRLLEKKLWLESKIKKLDDTITRSDQTDMPGTYVTGGSGVPASRIRKVEKQLGTRIERAKEAIRLKEQLDSVNRTIEAEKTAPKREVAKAKLNEAIQRQFDVIEVGDSIDVGGNSPLKVVKKNAKSVVTEGGSKWSANEVTKVIGPNGSVKLYAGFPLDLMGESAKDAAKWAKSLMDEARKHGVTISTDAGKWLEETMRRGLSAGRSAAVSAGKVAGVPGEVAKATIGSVTGTGKAAAEEALSSGRKLKGNPFKSQTDFDRAMRGDIPPERIVDTAKDALQRVKDKRAEAYRERFEALSAKNPPIKPTKTLNTLKTLMNRYNVKLLEDGTIDTSRAAMGVRGRKEIRGVIQNILNWGTQEGDLTATGLDTLKRQLDDFYSESSQARGFVASARDAVKADIVENVPEYAEMTRGYAEATMAIKDFEAGLMLRKNGMTGRMTADMTIRRLVSAMKDNFELRRDLVMELSEQGEADLMGQIAGYSMSTWVPRGLAGTGPALVGEAALMGHIKKKFWPLLMMGSPRLAGEFLRMVGKTQQEVGNLGGAVKDFAKDAPGDIARITEIRPAVAAGFAGAEGRREKWKTIGGED